MDLPDASVLIRVFVGESDQWQGMPLYEAIVRAAREGGMAGATVLRSPMGFGASSRLHTTKLLRLSEDLPMVVEIIDAREKVEAFLPTIRSMMQDGLVTVEDVRVIHYRGVPPAG